MTFRDPDITDAPVRGRSIPQDGLPYGGAVGDGRDPVPAGAPGDWRDEVATASGLNVIAGIWLIIAPFVLGYRSGDPYWNDIVFGAIVAVLALARVSGAYRQQWMSLLNALIGAWIFFSAFWLDSSGTAGANDIILGIIVFVLGVASASAGPVDDGATRPVRWRR